MPFLQALAEKSNMISMLSKYFRKILRNFPPTKESLLKVKNGPNKGLLINVSLGDYYIDGDYEIESISYMLEHLGKDDVVYDIGANAGYISMALAQRAKHVYAIEPMPLNLKRLERHLLRNRVQNVTALPYAICDENKTLQFTFSISHLANTYVQSSEYFSSKNTVEVQGRSIDSLVFEDSMPVPKLIKIDVEGAEFDALKGATMTLEKYSPIVFLSTHDFHLKGVKDSCLGFLRQKNYSFVAINEHKVDIDYDDFICQKLG